MTSRRSEKADPRAPSPPQLAEDVSRATQGAGKGKRLRPPVPSGGGAAVAVAEVRPPTHQPVRAADVRHPLEPNTRVRCRWKDSLYHQCRILESRRVPGTSPTDTDPSCWEYYVHYHKMNRRMDEWVQTDQFDWDTLEQEVVELNADGTRKKKKVDELMSSDDEEHGDFDPQQLREHEELTKVKNIEEIELGCHTMETWYFSPFPAEYRDCKKLYFCEFSLHFFKRRSQMLRHLSKCNLQHPPGDEIYRKDNVCMFEVDGRKAKHYCQNLSYLAKLFLDHKTLYYDVDLFLFYVLCETDDRGAHIVGYFSKEKMSDDGYNLACILTLPAYQRKGYGKFLISMSYELSKIEGKVGTPERPLSDLGLVSYRGYWTREILEVLRTHSGPISIKDLSDITCIKPDDILNTLNHLGLIQYHKGQHVLVAAPKLIERYIREAGSPGLRPDPSRIIWTPYDASKEYAAMKT